jgi:hypothetical protein
VADVTFGRDGRTRPVRGLRRLEMLPDADNPLLVFLGVDAPGDNAVFLVDSTLEQRGEGTCADRECTILSLAPGAEHFFRDDAGREYVLRIDRLRQVRVRPRSSSRDAAGARASSAGPDRSGDRGRALVSSLLVDVETVVGTAGTPSSSRSRPR